MKNIKIAFIGGGNMACSLIGGLISDGYSPQKIYVSDPDNERIAALNTNFPGINTTNSNEAAAVDADIVVFAVKPQIFKTAAKTLSKTLNTSKALVLSIAAGIKESDINKWLGDHHPIVRTMPNTPSFVQSGATALYANSHTSAEQRNQAESIMRAVGLTLWVENEEQMNAVTALSGSGPAYFFLVMEAMEKAGTNLGLTQKTARLLTLQTAFGAAKMALESNESCETLREHVTSPGGTTEQAINTLLDGDILALFNNALKAAHTRSIELAKILGD